MLQSGPTSVPRERRRRRRHRGNSRLATIGAVLCACIAALTAIVLAVSPEWKGAPQTQTDVPQYSADVEPQITDVSGTVWHPIYPYSVIAGGAHNRQELVDAIGRDQVVAEHYRTVSLDRVRVERLTEARRAYVSYRVGDRVFWTRHQVTLPAGEPILTDGVTQIRARCGNCISYEPQLPTSDAEPDAVEFEALAPTTNDLLPSRATPYGLVASAIMPNGHAPSSNLAPSLAAGMGGSDSTPPVSGTRVTDGGPISQARKKTVVQTLEVPTSVPDGQIAGAIPGDDSPGSLIPGGGSISDGSIPDDWILDGDNPDRPGDGILVGPFPGTLIPSETSGVDGIGESDVPPELVQPVPVPEPSTIVLVGTGVAGALWRRVRSRRKR